MFDMRTMGLISAVIPMALGVVMAVYWAARRVYPGFARWVVSNVLLGTGFLLINLRGYIPDFLSIIIGNILIIYSLVLVCEGLQLFFERNHLDVWSYAVFGLYIVFQVYYTYLSPDTNARIILASTASVYFNLRCVLILWRHAPSRLRHTTRNAAVVFMVSLLGSFLRGVYTIGMAQPLDIFADQYLFWYALVFLVTVIAWAHFAFFLNSTRLELELEDARQELTWIANTDPLTGVSNRRHFLECAEVEIERAKRFGHNLSFLVVDIDDFKTINDKNGHDVGDAVLLHLAIIFKEQLRSLDLVARFGGDEFFIMLLNVDQNQAFMIADRIRRVIDRTPVFLEEGPLHMKVSIGVSACMVTDNELNQVLKRADTALYRAKSEGRNHVVIA